MNELGKPIRSFSEDMVREHSRITLGELRDCEDRIKKHVTTCKREIINFLTNHFNLKKGIDKD